MGRTHTIDTQTIGPRGAVSRQSTVGALERLVEPALAAMGFTLVRVLLIGGHGSATLQVMAERADGSGVTVDDCAAISRSLSAVLDVEDPIPGAYALEVSSPGIDRPLVREADYDRFAGREARLETEVPVDGRRRFRGVLKGMRDGDVVIECDGADIVVPFAAIAKAKLVVTDELLARSLDKAKG